MNLRHQPTPALFFSLPLCAAMCLTACGDVNEAPGTDETAGSETATDTGDELGEGDGDGDPTTGDGDGDGDPSTGDGDGDPGCPVGSEGCPCTNGGGCDPGLTCEVGVCAPDSTGDGDGDPTTGDGDGDPTTGDGDGDGDDPNPLCSDDHFIEIAAVDADVMEGWEEAESSFGEGLVLGWDGEDPNAYVTWNIDVPCEGTWHIWVRGTDQGQNDSFFAVVDGEPDPAAIFELDCTGGPQQTQYVWGELNWRAQNAGACNYVEDPWVQEWSTGEHSLTLRYRESWGISKLWITNTEQTPP
ncbi:MAG: hypothetical protein R6X02_32995 [Enhygromyxa sp.]